MNDLLKSLALIGIASVVIHSIMTDKKEQPKQKEHDDDQPSVDEENMYMYIAENPKQEASAELDFSRKKRIYIKRLKSAHKQLQILQGKKDIKEYHRKKPEAKTKKKDVKIKIGEKEFVYKVPLSVKKAKIPV